MDFSLQLNPQDPPDVDDRPSYYTRNREQVRESQRLYRESNREKIRAIHRAYYLKNREKITAYKRQRWHQRKAVAIHDDGGDNSANPSTNCMYKCNNVPPRPSNGCQTFECCATTPKMQLGFLLNT
ncbi:hypothetical protein DYB32_010644 [Aphanomyces invadans]|uniref:Uncharacterized protein n=1 Tax=Aphanomyces invadans TaxID=157072 RepID=A0A3R7CSJ1_9STRA|nr:hypothetical protein DYB32_010644 [Aphanomyces invadans]